MREYSYYPGCSAKGLAKAYEASVLSVFHYLGLTLHELEDWNCCGATFFNDIDDYLAVGLAARNLCLAEKKGLDLVAPCSACFLGLLKAKDKLENNAEIRKKVLKGFEAAGLKYNGTSKIRHPLEVVINDFGLDKISEHVTHKLEGLRIAPYYGCQIVRPYSNFDDPVFPTSMDKLLRALGAEVTDYGCKTRCCGGALTGTIEDVGLRLNYILLHEAQRSGADCIVTVCPLCLFNLESYQKKINKLYGASFNIPILYFTQVMGLAFGIAHNKLGIEKAIISPEHLFATV